MNLCCELGELHRPKGIDMNSHNPCLLIKAVFSISSSLTLIDQKASVKSIVENDNIFFSQKFQRNISVQRSVHCEASSAAIVSVSAKPTRPAHSGGTFSSLASASSVV